VLQDALDVQKPFRQYGADPLQFALLLQEREQTCVETLQAPWRQLS
jgi:hypothetical protein